MTNDPIERRIEFLVEQQAKLTADVKQLTAGMRELRALATIVERQIGRNGEPQPRA